MKKKLALALALMLSTAGFAQKFGFCNSNALLAELPEVKAADSDLKDFQTQLTKRGQEMVKTLQEKAAFLTNAQANDYILFFEHDPSIECCSLKLTDKGVRPDQLFRLDELS